MNKTTILLAEDHAMVRTGLCAILNQEPDFEIVGEVDNGRQAVILAAQLKPDIIVMDIAMPQLNGMEATRQILLASPSAKILILSAHSDDAYVEQVMTLGAWGYLLKQNAASALPAAIRAIYQGKPYYSPTISRRRFHHQRKAKAQGDLPNPKAAKLTCREMEVLQLVAEGAANKSIADILCISIKTVEKHRQKVMEKLNIHETASLTRYAIAAGVIESSVHSTTDGGSRV